MQGLSLLVALSLVPARAIHEAAHVLGGSLWLDDWTITLTAEEGGVTLDWQPDAPWYAPFLAYLAPAVGVLGAFAVLAGLSIAGQPPATAVGRASTVITGLWLLRAGLLGMGDMLSAVALARSRSWTAAAADGGRA